MKQRIKRLIVLSIILLIITTITIMKIGNKITYTINNANTLTDYRWNVYDSTGKVELDDQKTKGNNLYLTFKGTKAGKVFVSLEYDGYKEIKILYVHNTKVITDNNFFGYSKGSESIPISIAIITIYLLYILIKEYKQSINDNIYQYKNIAYLGLIIFIVSFLINDILSIINYGGLYETISKVINSMSFFSVAIFIIAFITFLLVTIFNIQLIRKEGKSPKNLLGLFLGLFICILTILPTISYSFILKTQIINIFDLRGIGTYIYTFIETDIYLIVTYLECILIGTIIIGIKAARKKVSYDKDYMIILGCKIREDGTLTPLLKGRVDKALEFRNNQLKETKKDLIFIPSGGKGNDEIISEAEAIKNYLKENGIKEKNIILENKSKNTYENIKFSNKLIKKEKANICFSTTNYHVLRAGLIATNQSLKIEGIGSKTKSYFWINAFIREFIGTLYSEKKSHIITIIIINLILIFMILITYIANIL